MQYQKELLLQRRCNYINLLSLHTQSGLGTLFPSP